MVGRDKVRSDFKCISPKQISLYIASKNNGFGKGIYLQIPRIKSPIPLFIIYRALGIISDEEICSKIVLNTKSKSENVKTLMEGLRGSIVDAQAYLTEADSLAFITSNAMYTPLNMDKETGIRKKMEFTQTVLSEDLFPHCKTKEQKIYFLGYMTNRLLSCSFGWIKQDDRDSYMNKRIDLTGSLLNNLFRNYFNKLVKDTSKQIVREINNGSWRTTEDYCSIVNMTNIYKIVKSTTIENGIKRALATGDFGIRQTTSNKVGVAQVLNRLTYISSLSHLRRVNTPIDKSGKLIPPRKLHSTSWGFLCPAETPEGGSVGVVKNLSYMTNVTIPCNSTSLYDYVEPYIYTFEEMDVDTLLNGVKMFVNGAWLGNAKDPIPLYYSLKEKKYKCIINFSSSIIFDTNGRRSLINDAGRLTRPVLRVLDNKLILNRLILRNSRIRRLNGTICWLTFR